MSIINCSDNSAVGQRARVLKWLTSNSLTTKQAQLELDVMSVAARIFELKTEGHHIITHWERVPTASGGIRSIAKYVLLLRKEARS